MIDHLQRVITQINLGLPACDNDELRLILLLLILKKGNHHRHLLLQTSKIICGKNGN